MNVKSGFVAIIGLPNVGKSTLMNRLLGENLSIVSSKPQTTRKRVLGILSEKDYQIIFLDTPGILEPKYLMQKKLSEFIKQSITDADIILFMISAKEIEREIKIFEQDRIKDVLDIKNKIKILIVNKIDLSNIQILNPIIELLKTKNIFKEIIPVSSLENFNIDSVKESILQYLPIHPKYYPDDQLTDEPERFFVSEKIREKILEIYKDEIPYSVEVYIEDFKEREKGKDYISAVIVVERESQRPIILGKKGTQIKKLGNLARKSIENFLMREVYLELRVKVDENWRKNERALKNYGYSN